MRFVTLSNRLGKHYVLEGIGSGKAHIYLEKRDYLWCHWLLCFSFLKSSSNELDHAHRRFFSATFTLAEDHVVVSSPGDHNYAKECPSPPRLIFNIPAMLFFWREERIR